MLDTTKIEPLGNQILVQRSTQYESVSKGGIVIPESADTDECPTYEVLALGNVAKARLCVDRGSSVILKASARLTRVSRDHFLIRIKDVAAVVSG